MAKVSTLRSGAHALARQVIERAPLAPVTRLPSQGGRAGRTAVLVRASYQRRSSRPLDALRLLDRIPTWDLSPRGHTLRAQVLEDIGNLDEALLAAREGTALARPEVSALLTRLRIARAVGADADVAVCLDLACQVEPRNASEAAQVVRAFRSDDLGVVRAFVERVPQWRFVVPLADQARVEMEGLLACGVSEREISEAVLQRASESELGLQRAVLQLMGLRDWRALARLVNDRSVSPQIAKEVSRAAARALKDGWVDEAAGIADCAIRSGTGMNQARAVHAQAAEQQFVIRSGWPIERAQDRRYDPDPRSTLAVLAQSLPHRSGGYATRSHGILTGLRSRGWEPQVVTRLGFPYDRWSSSNTEEVPGEDVVDGIAYHRLLEPGERAYPTTPVASYIERFTARIMAQATQQRAALIHASSFQNNGLAGLAAARRLGIPFIYEMRGLEDLMKVSRNPAFADTGSYRFISGLENHIVAHADVTFVITEALREEMIQRGGPADRIVVLPNGVHTSEFEPRPRDARLQAELGLGERMVIGYAGGLVDYEGLDLLVEAAAALAERRSDFVVVIVGDGHMDARLRRLVEQMGLQEFVIFTGRVPHDEVARYLSLFDITPFPRLPLPVCELISPMKPFEAMAMGKAVIASSVAALTEIVEHDVRGLVFDKGDSTDFAAQLDRYLDSATLREEMGRGARQWVFEKQDWSDVVAVADSVYRRLLSEQDVIP